MKSFWFTLARNALLLLSRPIRLPILIFFFAFAIPQILLGQARTPFSSDSATMYLKTIAVDIGARPMGSRQERQAMEFAIQKFRAFGLHEAYILPMRSTTGGYGSSPTNTSSGTAVGVLHGKSDRTIVIGAHIDSDNPDVPGANDDGSGSAVVIELARLLSQRANESTIVFALFGGEERGLRGSRHFVANYARIDNVALMLQIDMANGSDWLLPLIDAGTISSPEWLVRAAYEELGLLGYAGLSYPTHFFALMSAAPGGGIGSDHIPFLERGIPAIDFTSDINDPIHTSEDTFENFAISGLKRSGDLVYRLVERFDGGVPNEAFSKYYLIQIGSLPYFVPLWILWFVIGASLVLSIVVLLWMRRRRVPEPERARIPGLKLFLLMLIIQALVWISSHVVGLIKGDRYPWFADSSGYFILGFVAAIGGIWLSLGLARSMRISREPYRHYLRSIIFLLVFVVLFLNLSVKLALYPAFALIILSLAVWVRVPWLKLALWALSPYLMVRLIFSEGFDLMTRSSVAASSGSLTSDLIVLGIAILLCSILAFPFLLGFAAIRFQSPLMFDGVRMMRWNWVGVGIAIVFIFTAVYLSWQPSYSDKWRQPIRIDQHYDENRGIRFVEISSPDFLDGAVVTWQGVDTVISDKVRRVRLGPIAGLRKSWIRLPESDTSFESRTQYEMVVMLTFKHRPYTVELSYRNPEGDFRDVTSPFVFQQSRRGLIFRWESDLDTVLTIPIAFTVETGSRVQESVHATFLEELEPVEVQLGHSTLIRRTRMTISRYLGPPAKSSER